MRVVRFERADFRDFASNAVGFGRRFAARGSTRSGRLPTR
jgi:hypothetical protein